jgi:hypothetical protein
LFLLGSIAVVIVAPHRQATAKRASRLDSRFLGGALTQGRDHAAMTTARLLPDAGPAIFRALVGGGPQTAREVADRVGLEERYVRDWLGRQADRGCVTYDATAEIFLLTPEQEATLAGQAVQTQRPGGQPHG